MGGTDGSGEAGGEGEGNGEAVGEADDDVADGLGGLEVAFDVWGWVSVGVAVGGAGAKWHLGNIVHGGSLVQAWLIVVDGAFGRLSQESLGMGESLSQWGHVCMSNATQGMSGGTVQDGTGVDAALGSGIGWGSGCDFFGGGAWGCAGAGWSG